MTQGRLQGVRVVVFAAILATGCGSNTLTPQDATVAPPETEPIPTETAAPPVPALSYSSATITYTRADGWTYKIIPHLAPITFVFSKDVVNSPPGKARLVISATVASELSFEVVGATPGRNAPPASSPRWTVLLPLPVELGVNSSNARRLGISPDFNCNYFGQASYDHSLDKYVSEGGLSSPEFYQCSNAQFVFTGGTAVSYEDDEAFIDRIIAGLRNSPPIVLVGANDNDSRSCGAFLYWPDGTKTTIAAKCKSVFG